MHHDEKPLTSILAKLNIKSVLPFYDDNDHLIGLRIREDLTAFPTDLCQLHQLQELDLEMDRLRELPGAIGQLTNLRALRLFGNELRALPSQLSQLPHLQVLDLGGNELRALPAEIGRLKNLRELHFDDNPLEGLPAEIESLIKQPRRLSASKPLRVAQRRWREVSTAEYRTRRRMSTLVLQNKMYAPHLQELRQTLGASDQFTKKGPNKTLFEIENHASNIQNRVELYVLVKVFTSSVHLFPYHEGWGFYEIEVPLARKILMHMLATDLVYPTYRHMPDEQATSLIEQMLHFFSSNVRCFTNCQFDVDFTLNECEAKGINIFDHYSWAPFIMRTYNMGVVLVDEQNIGVLWRGTWIYRAPSFHFRSFPREISHPVWRGRDKLCLGWGRPRLEEITDHWLP